MGYKKGDQVKYIPYHAEGNTEHQDCEIGSVTSTNDTYVFVLFHYPYKRSGPQACLPSQLIKL